MRRKRREGSARSRDHDCAEHWRLVRTATHRLDVHVDPQLPHARLRNPPREMRTTEAALAAQAYSGWKLREYGSPKNELHRVVKLVGPLVGAGLMPVE
jgi:hypothetical protein